MSKEALNQMKHTLFTGNALRKMVEGKPLTLDEQRAVTIPLSFAYARFDGSDPAVPDADDVRSNVEEREGVPYLNKSDAEIAQGFKKLQAALTTEMISLQWGDTLSGVGMLHHDTFEKHPSTDTALNHAADDVLRESRVEYMDSNCYVLRMNLANEPSPKKKAEILTKELDGLREQIAKYGLEGYQIDLSGVDLSGVNLSGINLDNVNLSKANLKGTNLAGASLQGANLQGARCDKANFHQANLAHVQAAGASFNGAYMVQANLNDASIQGARFVNANLEDAKIQGVHGTGANFSSARLKNAEFNSSDLPHAKFAKANVEGADFDGAVLSKTALVGAKHVKKAENLPDDVAKEASRNPLVRLLYAVLEALGVRDTKESPDKVFSNRRQVSQLSAEELATIEPGVEVSRSPEQERRTEFGRGTREAFDKIPPDEVPLARERLQSTAEALGTVEGVTSITKAQKGTAVTHDASMSPEALAQQQKAVEGKA